MQEKIKISVDSNMYDLQLSRELNDFDKKVWHTIAALTSGQKDSFTPVQVHFAMGGTTDPTINQLRRVVKSIEKISDVRYSLSYMAETKNHIPKKINVRDYLLCTKESITKENGSSVYQFRLLEQPSLMKWAMENNRIAKQKMS